MTRCYFCAKIAGKNEELTAFKTGVPGIFVVAHADCMQEESLNEFSLERLNNEVLSLAASTSSRAENSSSPAPSPEDA